MKRSKVHVNISLHIYNWYLKQKGGEGDATSLIVISITHPLNG
jgi:hypothetical protein